MSDETFRVVRGNPTPEELAAALAVVQVRAASGPPAPAPARPTDEWASPRSLLHRRVPRAGASAWRTTYWPV
ncbi:acyl-CoA carboxylase subunit epsilon [Streptomyces sp. NPDC051940]|uniref:acyl-CoA carboxylase subunit epsilon n=1 Tax=Streptomyces sp. NPDC051940 TaxID=3155675 RepID=UPI00343A0051